MAQSSIYHEAGAEFRSLFHTYNACMQRMLSKYGLYPGQPQMLFAIRELNSPTQNELLFIISGISCRNIKDVWKRSWTVRHL